MICTRGKPSCLLCPFEDVCVAHEQGDERRYPGSKPKRELPTRRTQMLLLQDDTGRVLLEQRPPSGLWGGLWGFPQFDGDRELHDWLERRYRGSHLGTAWQPFIHTFTPFRLEITPRPARLPDRRAATVAESNQQWVDPAAPANVGLAAPVKTLLATLAQAHALID